MDTRKGFTYLDAGVDVDAAEGLVEPFRRMAEATRRPEVLGAIGGFGGLFRPALEGFEDPVLVGSADGVGTKLRIAFQVGDHDTVGIDLVAMVVNDLLPQAAEPLFLLDYFATGRLEPGVPETVVKGIAEGCRQAGCALLGGETAEMPDSYPAGEYDLAGFAVGIVDRPRIPLPESVRPGDVLLGLGSSGLHSNGYSLVRRTLLDHRGLDPHLPVPALGDQPLGKVLLEPTRIYVRPVLEATRQLEVHGMAHVTGGGLEGKLPRSLPPGVVARIDRDSWAIPPVFGFLIEEGGVDAEDAWRTFNMGIGYVFVLPAASAGEAERVLGDAGESVYRIGEIDEAGPEEPPIAWTGAGTGAPAGGDGA